MAMRGTAVSAAALLLAGCAGGGHEVHGPAGIPYDCGGEFARVFHEAGGSALRARATLHYRDREIPLAAAPGAAGLRYASEPEEGRVLIWTEVGDSARLGSAPIDQAALSEGEEVASCRRIRDPDAALPRREGDAEGHH